MAKVYFIFWCLVALFILVPITNTVVQSWVSSNGTLASTFNSSDMSSWNATGEITTSEQVSRINLTPFEQAVTVFYIPAMVIFFVVIIIYVLSNWGSNRGGGGM